LNQFKSNKKKVLKANKAAEATASEDSCNNKNSNSQNSDSNNNQQNKIFKFTKNKGSFLSGSNINDNLIPNNALVPILIRKFESDSDNQEQQIHQFESKNVNKNLDSSKTSKNVESPKRRQHSVDNLNVEKLNITNQISVEKSIIIKEI